MKRILLSCALLAALTLPVAASARERAQAKPGYLVVRQAAGDGGVNGHAIVTLIVHGFVLGSVSPQDEARIDIYQLLTPGGGGAPQTTPNVSRTAVSWNARKGQHSVPGHSYRGSGFRFRALGGYYRVVVRGSGVYLFAGGVGKVTLHGSSFDRRGDGKFSIDSSVPRSLPTNPLTRHFGRS
jgi:hypothetical protein